MTPDRLPESKLAEIAERAGNSRHSLRHLGACYHEDIPALLEHVRAQDEAMSFARDLLNSFDEDVATLPQAVRELKRLRKALTDDGGSDGK